MSEDIDNNEQQESIDDLLKRVQILKIEAELKDSKKNYFRKYIYPELPKWIPVLFLGLVTLWITSSKDILGTKEDKLSIREDKVDMSEKKLEIETLQENIKKLTTIQDKKADSVTQLDIEYLEKLNEIKNLNTKIASIQVLYESERNKAIGLERQQFELQNQNRDLAKESLDIKVNSLTESIYHNPYINNKYVYEAIDIIKGQTEIGKMLTKEFESNIKKAITRP